MLQNIERSPKNNTVRKRNKEPLLASKQIEVVQRNWEVGIYIVQSSIAIIIFSIVYPAYFMVTPICRKGSIVLVWTVAESETDPDVYLDRPW